MTDEVASELDALPADVRDLLVTTVDSLEKLEVLLHAAREPDLQLLLKVVGLRDLLPGRRRQEVLKERLRVSALLDLCNSYHREIF